MFCPNCGTKVEEGRFCPNCGGGLVWEEISLTEQAAEPGEAPAEAVHLSAAPKDPTVVPPTFAAAPVGNAAPPTAPLSAPAAQPAAPAAEPAEPAGATVTLPPPGDATAAQSYPSYEAYAPVYPGAGYGAPLQPRYDDPVRETIRRLASSPLFLIGVITFTASIVLTLIGNVLFSGNIGEALERLVALLRQQGLDIDELPSGIGYALGSASISSAVSSIIPSFVIGVGLWLVYLSAKGSKYKGVCSGLTILRVMSIIMLVFACIGVGILLITLLLCVLIGGIAVMEYDNSMSTLVIMVFAIGFAVCAAVGALCIVFYAKLKNTVSTVRNTWITGIPSDRVSTFVAVMLFLFALMQALGGFSAFGLYDVLGQSATGASRVIGSIAAIVLALADAATQVCFGILIFRYRRAMRELTGQ